MSFRSLLSVAIVALLVAGCSRTTIVEEPSESIKSNENTIARLVDHAKTAANAYVAFKLEGTSLIHGTKCQLESFSEPRLLFGNTIQYSLRIYCGPKKKWSRYTDRLSCTYSFDEQYEFVTGTRDWQAESSRLNTIQSLDELSNGQLYDGQPCPASE
jgi:hypothetical protein